MKCFRRWWTGACCDVVTDYRLRLLYGHAKALTTLQFGKFFRVFNRDICKINKGFCVKKPFFLSAWPIEHKKKRGWSGQMSVEKESCKSPYMKLKQTPWTSELYRQIEAWENLETPVFLQHPEKRDRQTDRDSDNDLLCMLLCRFDEEFRPTRTWQTGRISYILGLNVLVAYYYLRSCCSIRLLSGCDVELRSAECWHGLCSQEKIIFQQVMVGTIWLVQNYTFYIDLSGCFF